MFAHYEDIKGDEKCKNWGGLGSYGSPKVIKNIAIWYSTHDFLFDFNRNYASILYGFRVITLFSSKVAHFNPHHLDLSPRRGWSRSNFAVNYGIRKLESNGYRMAIFVWSWSQISSIWWKDRENRSSRYWDSFAHSKKRNKTRNAWQSLAYSLLGAAASAPCK